MYILSRKQAFRLAWELFWMATGSARVGIKTTESNVILSGDALVESDTGLVE